MLSTVEETVRMMLAETEEIDFTALVDKLQADDSVHSAVRYTTTKVIALLKEVESKQTQAFFAADDPKEPTVVTKL